MFLGCSWGVLGVFLGCSWGVLGVFLGCSACSWSVQSFRNDVSKPLSGPANVSLVKSSAHKIIGIVKNLSAFFKSWFLGTVVAAEGETF